MTPIVFILVLPTCDHSIISPSLLGISLGRICSTAFFAALPATAEETLAEENETEQADHDSRHDDHDEVDLLEVPDIVSDLFVEAYTARD